MENRMLSAIHEIGTNARVSEVMDQNFVYVDLKAPLDEVYRQLLSTHKTAAAVLENGRLKGVLCLDGISRYFMIQNALRDMRGAQPS